MFLMTYMSGNRNYCQRILTMKKAQRMCQYVTEAVINDYLGVGVKGGLCPCLLYTSDAADE